MNNSFANLKTVKNVHEPLKPAAARIYQSIFPKARIENLRAEGFKVHILDKEFGIDSLLHMQSGQWISIQEKYRSYPCWNYHDFTQEVENGDGTEGEWSKLGAQFYFYGWGDPSSKFFLEWYIFDIVKYKLLIEQLGGIYQVGVLRQNNLHGKAKFIGIDLKILMPAILFMGNGINWLQRIDKGSFSEPKNLMPPFLLGTDQPCQQYQSDKNLIAYCKCGAIKYQCKNCKKYHHANGWDSCQNYQQ